MYRGLHLYSKPLKPGVMKLYIHNALKYYLITSYQYKITFNLNETINKITLFTAGYRFSFAGFNVT